MVAKATRNREREAAGWAALTKVVRETLGASEVYGAIGTLRRAAGALASEGLVMSAASAQSLLFRESDLPAVTFDEAVRDMMERVPVTLRDAAERTAQRVSELYSERAVVAFARASDPAITERVQALLSDAMRRGLSEVTAAEAIAETADWTQAYSRLAVRNNVATATTAGRFRQAQDPVVRAVIPCMRFDATMDADTRENHAAANGRIWRTTNAVWGTLAPPLGHNCRCSVALVTVADLRRLGRITASGQIIEDSVPPGAFPDPGFRHAGRPDLFLSR